MEFKVNEWEWTDGGKGIGITIKMLAGYSEHEVNFIHRCQSEMEKDFMYAALQDQFEEHIKKIRKAAYEAGWRDKMKRRKKETWFGWCPNFIDPFK